MTLSLPLVELIVLCFCAVILGVVIHFFITSRKSLKTSTVGTDKIKKDINDWKLKYFNDIEIKDKELSELKDRLSEMEETSHIYKVENDELKRQHKRVQFELESAKKNEPLENKPNYIEQLRLAQTNLLEQNQKINQLLENIETVKENEEQKKLIEEEKEQLLNQVKELKYLLGQKEAEIYNIRQKENLTREMNSMLDSAYSEFNTLQTKIQKLEAQLTSSKMVSLEYEDLKEAYVKVSREHDEYKAKLQALTLENQQMSLQLNE
ncbi:MAG TPA: hypothetical protein VGG71_09105, partial [Chitinophagaceae bacterium]